MKMKAIGKFYKNVTISYSINANFFILCLVSSKYLHVVVKNGIKLVYYLQEGYIHTAQIYAMKSPASHRLWIITNTGKIFVKLLSNVLLESLSDDKKIIALDPSDSDIYIKDVQSMLYAKPFYIFCSWTVHGDVIRCYQTLEIEETNEVILGNEIWSHFFPADSSTRTRHCTVMYHLYSYQTKCSGTQHVVLNNQMFSMLFNTPRDSKQSVILYISNTHLVHWSSTKKLMENPQILLDLNQEILLIGSVNVCISDGTNYFETTNSLFILGKDGLLLVYFINQHGDCDNIYLTLYGPVTAAAYTEKFIFYSTSEGIFYTSLEKINLELPSLESVHVPRSVPAKSMNIYQHTLISVSMFVVTQRGVLVDQEIPLQPTNRTDTVNTIPSSLQKLQHLSEQYDELTEKQNSMNKCLLQLNIAAIIKTRTKILETTLLVTQNMCGSLFVTCVIACAHGRVFDNNGWSIVFCVCENSANSKLDGYCEVDSPGDYRRIKYFNDDEIESDVNGNTSNASKILQISTATLNFTDGKCVVTFKLPGELKAGACLDVYSAVILDMEKLELDCTHSSFLNLTELNLPKCIIVPVSGITEITSLHYIQPSSPAAPSPPQTLHQYANSLERHCRSGHRRSGLCRSGHLYQDEEAKYSIDFHWTQNDDAETLESAKNYLLTRLRISGHSFQFDVHNSSTFGYCSTSSSLCLTINSTEPTKVTLQGTSLQLLYHIKYYLVRGKSGRISHKEALTEIDVLGSLQSKVETLANEQLHNSTPHYHEVHRELTNLYQQLRQNAP